MKWSVLPEPEQVAPCDVCGVYVLLYPFPGGGAVVWDPDLLQRRWVRSLVGPADLARRGFGWGIGRAHECPPEGHTPAEEMRDLRRAAGWDDCLGDERGREWEC